MSLANGCRVLSPHYWECMEHYRKLVTCKSNMYFQPHILTISCWTPHIFLRYYVVIIHCCFLLSTSVSESHSSTCPKHVCNMSFTNDRCVLSLHYWKCMEHYRKLVTCTSNMYFQPHFLTTSCWTPHIFLRYYVVVIQCCFLLPPTSASESHSFTCPNDVCDMSLANNCFVLSPHYLECMEHNSQ